MTSRNKTAQNTSSLQNLRLLLFKDNIKIAQHMEKFIRIENNILHLDILENILWVISSVYLAASLIIVALSLTISNLIIFALPLTVLGVTYMCLAILASSKYQNLRGKWREDFHK